MYWVNIHNEFNTTEEHKMETKHIYEIYTKNPKTGESGWDIKFVLATKSTIKLYPNFDCIITVDDYPLQNPRPKLINFI